MSKTTMRDQVTPTSIARIKKRDDEYQSIEKLEPKYADGGNVNWYSCFAKQSGGSSKH
jgi:hypothetical protein